MGDYDYRADEIAREVLRRLANHYPEGFKHEHVSHAQARSIIEQGLKEYARRTK